MRWLTSDKALPPPPFVLAGALSAASVGAGSIVISASASDPALIFFSALPLVIFAVGRCRWSMVRKQKLGTIVNRGEGNSNVSSNSCTETL